MHHRFFWFLLVSFTWVGACVPGLEVDPDTAPPIRCRGPEDCPPNMFCSSVASRCIQEGASDLPPRIEALPLSEVPVGPGQIVTVEFSVLAQTDSGESEAELLGAPTVQVLLPGGELVGTEPATATQLGYAYQYTVRPADSEGRAVFLIEIVDKLGSIVRSDSVTFAIDPTPPGFRASPGFAYVPKTPALLSAGEARRGGARVDVEVTIAISEEVDGPPDVNAVSVGGAAPIPAVLVSQPADTVFVYQFFIDSSIAEGTYAVETFATDLAGNRNLDPMVLNTAQELEFIVDHTPPPAPTNLLLTRIPWSSDVSGDVSVMRLDGETQDPDEFEVKIFVWDRELPPGTGPIDDNRLKIAERVQTTGVFNFTELGISDRRDLWVSTVDSAGNESAVVRVLNGQWTANVFGRVSGDDFENPNRFTSSPQPARTLREPLHAEPSTAELEALARRDDTFGTLSIESERVWVQRRPTSPPAIDNGSMVHMSSIGVTYLVGGNNEQGATSTLWEWNGEEWGDVQVLGAQPAPRIGALAAYDSARDRLVLFGGTSTFASWNNDVWEWDGQSWTDVTPPIGSDGPSPRGFGAIAYDAARRLVIFYGGIQSVPPATPCPSGEAPTPIPGGDSLCMANELWAWDGVAWQQLCDAAAGEPGYCGAAPGPRFLAGMTYDPLNQRIVMLSGFSGTALNPLVLDETWALDATGWSPLAAAPVGRVPAGMVYDTTLQRVLAVGGCDAGTVSGCEPDRASNEVWMFDDTLGWQTVVPNGGLPRPRALSGAAFDSARSRTMIFGGSAAFDIIACDEALCGPGGFQDLQTGEGTISPNVCRCTYATTWALDTAETSPGDTSASAWRSVSAPGGVPQASSEAALAYNPNSGVSVMFGGEALAGDCDGLGLVDGSLPEDPCQNGAQPGSSCFISECDSTWEWDGSRWVLRSGGAMACSGASCPSPRVGSAMAHLPGDPQVPADEGAMIMFGGTGRLADAPCAFCNLWEWRSGTWSVANSLDPGRFHDPSGCVDLSGNPAPCMRHDAAMASWFEGGDPAVLLYGGRTEPTDPSGNCPLGSALPSPSAFECVYRDAWIWDGTSWTGPLLTTANRRGGHAMVYDSLRNAVVMYGGCQDYDGGCDNPLGETHVWDAGATDWRRIIPNPIPSPGPIFEHALAYDPHRGMALLIGGRFDDLQGSATVWEFDGTQWKSFESTGARPFSISSHGFVYDPLRNRALLMGSGASGEMWEYVLDPQNRPSAIYEFALDDARVGAEHVTGFSLLVDATAEGFLTDPGFEGASVPGLEVAAWSANTSSWVPLLSDGATEPQAATFTPAVGLPSDYVQGGRMFFRLQPTAGDGTGPRPAHIELDYAELVVDYTL